MMPFTGGRPGLIIIKNMMTKGSMTMLLSMHPKP
jgi:hypothetical protein